jgi:hypothetical protein
MQDFIIPTEKVMWGKESANGLEVRGLSFHDFTVLFSQYGSAVDKIFELIEGDSSAAKDFAESIDVKAFGADLIKKAPQLVATLIALAADIPDRATQTERIPLPVQIKLLEAIYRLTVEDTGGLTNFIQLVMGLAKEVRLTARAFNPTIPLNDIGTLS